MSTTELTPGVQQQLAIGVPVDGSSDGTIGLPVPHNVLSLRLRVRTGATIVLSTG